MPRCGRGRPDATGSVEDAPSFSIGRNGRRNRDENAGCRPIQVPKAANVILGLPVKTACFSGSPLFFGDLTISGGRRILLRSFSTRLREPLTRFRKASSVDSSLVFASRFPLRVFRGGPRQEAEASRDWFAAAGHLPQRLPAGSAPRESVFCRPFRNLISRREIHFGTGPSSAARRRISPATCGC
jgi:hypothetical protein